MKGSGYEDVKPNLRGILHFTCVHVRWEPEM